MVVGPGSAGGGEDEVGARKLDMLARLLGAPPPKDSDVAVEVSWSLLSVFRSRNN